MSWSSSKLEWWAFGPTSATYHRGHRLLLASRGIRPASNHHSSTIINSFRCLLTCKSRWSNNKPNLIAIGSRGLSTAGMPSVSWRHWGSSITNSKLKLLPSRTISHRGSQKASVKSVDLPISDPLMSWSIDGSWKSSCKATRRFQLPKSLTSPLRRHPGVRIPKKVFDSNLRLLFWSEWSRPAH